MNHNNLNTDEKYKKKYFKYKSKYLDYKNFISILKGGTQQYQSEAHSEAAMARTAQLAAAKAERKKAAQARAAAKKTGGSTQTAKKTPTASQLLSKKSAKKVSPDYKQQKASGKTRAERDKIRGEGERYLKSVFTKQETDKYKKATGQNPDQKGKMKIAGRVNQRMK
mgnify:CR=1 FL=1